MVSKQQKRNNKPTKKKPNQVVVLKDTNNVTIKTNHLEALRLPEVMSSVLNSRPKKLAKLMLTYSHSPDPDFSPFAIWLIHV